MHKPQRESFVIEVRGFEREEALDQPIPPPPCPKFSFSAMKLFTKFRKLLVKLVFSVPSRRSSPTSSQTKSDRFEPPKTSYSSYYSSYSHYNEAIADCIEFINKSAQDGVLDGRKSEVV